MTKQQAAKLLRERYLKSWGGLGLDIDPVGHENDNAILFLAYAYRMLQKDELLTEGDKDNWLYAINEIEVQQGLYKRYPGCAYEDQHDNYIGICLGSVIFGETQEPTDILHYGARHLYNYNDKDPGRWTLRTQRQPGEVAVYSLAANKAPGWFTTIYLAIGMSTASTGILAWARAEIITEKKHVCWWPKRKLLEWGVAKMHKRWTTDLGKTWHDHFYNYFNRPGHPIQVLSEGL